MTDPGSDFVLQDEQTWVCLGDSITEDPGGYVSVCSREIRTRFPERRIKVVNAGVSGNKSGDVLSRLGRDVLSHDPDWVSISVGVNDVWHGFYHFDLERPRPAYDKETGNPLDSFRSDLEDMVRQLLDAKVRILLIAPTPIGDVRTGRENVMLGDYVQSMERLADRYELAYCPMNDLFWQTLAAGRNANQDFALTTDGVHMNPAGVSMMAVGVLTSLGFYPGSGQ